MHRIRDLQRVPDRSMFEKKVKEFYHWLLNDELVHRQMGVQTYARMPNGDRITAKEDFQKYFEAHWNGEGGQKAHMWARFGRNGTFGANVSWQDTNDMIERYFLQEKHSLSKIVKTQKVSSHVQFLNNIVIPWYIHDRQQMLDGILMSGQKQTMAHTVDRTVDWLRHSTERLSIIDSELGLGTALDRCDPDVAYTFCLADMSCSCHAPHAIPCVHLEAASASTPVTVSMIQNACDMIGKNRLLQSSNRAVVDGLFKCKKIARFFSAQKKQAWLKQEREDQYAFCECFVFKEARICCHILALGMGSIEGSDKACPS